MESGRPSIDPELDDADADRLAIASAFARNGGCARRSTSIWPIAGFAELGARRRRSGLVIFPTFSKNRHGRFRESDLLRKLFETVVARCMKERIVGGEAFAVDASIIVADAHRRRGVAKVEDLDPASSRAFAEYLRRSWMTRPSAGQRRLSRR